LGRANVCCPQCFLICTICYCITQRSDFGAIFWHVCIFATSTILSLFSFLCTYCELPFPSRTLMLSRNHLWYFAFALWNICFGMQQTSLSHPLKSTHQKHHHFPPFRNCTVLLRVQHQQKNTKHNCTVLLRAQHQQQNTKQQQNSAFAPPSKHVVKLIKVSTMVTTKVRFDLHILLSRFPSVFSPPRFTPLLRNLWYRFWDKGLLPFLSTSKHGGHFRVLLFSHHTA